MCTVQGFCYKITCYPKGNVTGTQGRGSATIFRLTACEQALRSHGEASKTPTEVGVQRVGVKFRATKPQGAEVP